MTSARAGRGGTRVRDAGRMVLAAAVPAILALALATMPRPVRAQVGDT